MTKDDFRLDRLMEECAEVIQRASKQLRFGCDEMQPGQQQANHERLREEILDVFVAVRKLEQSGQIMPITKHQVTMWEKQTTPKINRMYELSIRLGRLTKE